MRAMDVVAGRVTISPGVTGWLAQLMNPNVQRAVFPYWAVPGAAGTAITCAWKVTVTVAPAAIVPSATPGGPGSAPGRRTPPTVKLFGTNVVPGGTSSRKTTLSAFAVPVLTRSTVYVSTSSTRAVGRSTRFVSAPKRGAPTPIWRPRVVMT